MNILFFFVNVKTIMATFLPESFFCYYGSSI